MTHLPKAGALFYCSGHPRDVPSFPTRRSSDLEDAEGCAAERRGRAGPRAGETAGRSLRQRKGVRGRVGDRKSTRLNSSHSSISYAVFCLKKKNSCSELASKPRDAVTGAAPWRN